MSISIDSFQFPPDVAWPDRFGYSPVVGRSETLITGRTCIQSSVMTNGRKITLDAGSVGEGYCGLFNLAQVEALKAIYDQADAVRTLTIGAEVFSVRFDRLTGGLGIEPLATVRADQKWTDRIYKVTTRFIVVADENA